MAGAAVANSIKSLLGVSAFQKADPSLDGTLIDSPSVDRIRETFGGQLSTTPFTQVRWLMRDLESAQYEADSGVMLTSARLWNAAKRDGVFAGVLSTRTNGLVRLPKRFRGNLEMIAQLELGSSSVRSVFDEMLPPSELALLAEDGIGLGVGVGELMPVEGRDYPVLVRQPPENLIYWWSRNRWFYRSIAGPIPIVPGDGRWVLHMPGGRVAPWQNGIWRAVGRAFIAKEHAIFMDSNWQGTLANPARVAECPQASTDTEMNRWFQQVAAWGLNSTFAMKPGWGIKLLESNGRGHEAFGDCIERSEREMIIAVAGQAVTTDGGAGFQNSDVHKSIRSDLIKATADALAYTINTQCIPPWAIARWGEESLANCACVEWDVTPPKDRNSEAQASVGVAAAIEGLTKALQKHGLDLDIDEMCSRFNVPVRKDPGNAVIAADLEALDQALQIADRAALLPKAASVADLLTKATGAEFEEKPATSVPVANLDVTPTDVAKVVTVDEIRASQGLPPMGGDRGSKTIPEIEAENQPAPEAAPTGEEQAA